MALEDLYKTIVARAVKVARENAIMPRLVANMLEGEPMGVASVVQVPIIQDPLESMPVVPGVVSPGSARPNPGLMPVTMDYYRYTAFTLTSKDVTFMEQGADFIPKQLQAAAAGLARGVDQYLMAFYKKVYGFAGTPGVVPFGISTVEAQEATRVLSTQLCPKNMGSRRAMVLNEFAYANALGLPVLQRVDASGNSDVLRDAVIGRVMGFEWYEDQLVVMHTNPNGTPAGWLVDAGVGGPGVAIGNTTLLVDGGANNPVEGDIFTVAGDDQTYVVVSYFGSTITFQPPAKVLWADNAAVTFKGDHAVNLAFDENAIAWGSAPIDEVLPGTANVMRWVDDVSGLVLSLEVERQHFQTEFKLSVLGGGALVQPRYAVRVAG